jgi:long-chain acyl-CoA synthetase
VAELSVRDEAVDRGALDNRAPSIAHLFRHRVAQSGSRQAFQYFRGEVLEHLTWDETKERADAWAAGLIALGVGLEDRVAILSTTRLDWALADLAIMSAGAATTTIYPSSAAADVTSIVADSDSRIVFARTTSRSRSCASTGTRRPRCCRS